MTQPNRFARRDLRPDLTSPGGWLATVCRPAGLLLLILLASLTAACGPTEEQLDEIREEIRATLMEYLPEMAKAYRTGDVEPLAEYTTQKERAILLKSIRELEQKGLSYDTELLELTIEDLNVVKFANAYVTTVEYWDVTTYAVGTDRVVGHDPRQFSRVRYQLKREGDGWTIMARNRDPSINP